MSERKLAETSGMTGASSNDSRGGGTSGEAKGLNKRIVSGENQRRALRPDSWSSGRSSGSTASTSFRSDVAPGYFEAIEEMRTSRRRNATLESGQDRCGARYVKHKSA
jgi:hypothetical protein